MTIEWSSSGLDFHLELAPDVSPGIGLMDAIRSAVRDGRLAPEAVLPSTRALAAELGVARGTVTAAYRQLAAEGYLVTAQGAPTRVAALPGARAQASPREIERYSWVFQPGLPELGSFPRQQWLAAVRGALAGMPATEPSFPHPRGHPRLRTVLANYLGRARGVRADPERIVVCSGYAHALGVLAGVLAEQGVTEVAFEEPSMFRYRAIVARRGLRTTPVEVDEFGARVAELQSPVFVVGAAHQFPLGVSLHQERRASLVRREDVLVVEDDYDGEFRFSGPKPGALQALAPEQVIYAGTVSKTLGPGMRLSWLVLPERLVEPVSEAMRAGEQAANVLDQLTLAEFIDSGRYDSLIRRSRSMYRTRRARLLSTLEDLPLTPQGIPAGLQTLFLLPDGLSEPDCVARLAGHSVLVEPLGRHWMLDRDRPGGILIGYGAPPKHAFNPGLRALRAALLEACGRGGMMGE